MEALKPEYEIGASVEYIDHHGRIQIGEVRAIEARWSSLYGGKPSVIYTLSHPSYRNKRIHAGVRDIIGPTDRLSQGA